MMKYYRVETKPHKSGLPENVNLVFQVNADKEEDHLKERLQEWIEASQGADATIQEISEREARALMEA